MKFDPVLVFLRSTGLYIILVGFGLAPTDSMRGSIKYILMFMIVVEGNGWIVGLLLRM